MLAGCLPTGNWGCRSRSLGGDVLMCDIERDTKGERLETRLMGEARISPATVGFRQGGLGAVSG